MMFKNILVAHDGTACSDLAMDYAFTLAKNFEAQVTVCHVTDFSQAALVMSGPAIADGGAVYEALHQEGESIATHIRATALRAGVTADICDVGSTPASGILQTAAKSGCDLIVVGSHGKHGLRRLIDPSVSLQVSGSAHVPILIVPRDAPGCGDA